MRSNSYAFQHLSVITFLSQPQQVAWKTDYQLRQHDRHKSQQRNEGITSKFVYCFSSTKFELVLLELCIIAFAIIVFPNEWETNYETSLKNAK